MSVGVLTVLLLVLAALGDARALVTTDQARRPRVDHSAILAGYSNPSKSRIFARIDHNPVVDSLPVPISHPSASVTPSSHDQLTTTIVIVILAFVGLCSIVAV
ncbi:hypothetical protein L210DRAFT_2701645 [Boletus edulis BED1]|uniref:Uncharacterized protein n=1 Tax=Boletus edulis BED1 TaxID=1328754 RepID=A0AAD4G5P3_BOLED|nr:hypothetical protein L210DRAFT_2701645 [Boletus edulis BED1]